MRNRRIYVDTTLESGVTLELPEEAAHYLRKVLRLSDGSQVTLFDGSGFEYTAKLIFAGKKQASATLLEAIETDKESPLDIHLGIGISRGERMDFIMQKSTELGVKTVTPLFTDRCEVKIENQRLEKRLDHWRRISISACEQSGRSRLPTIMPATDVGMWSRALNTSNSFILHPSEDANPLPAEIHSNQIALLIGPEGGFEDSEVAAAVNQGFTCIRLGPRILRTETAPIAAISAMQILWGDYR